MTPGMPVNVLGECPGPCPAPCPFGSCLPPAGWYGTVGNTLHSMAVARRCGPYCNQSIDIQSLFCELMPSAMPIGSNLGIYAALAEIPPRPDGGLPNPRHLLHGSRWRFLACYKAYLSMKISPPCHLPIMFTLRPGHATSATLRTLRPRLLYLLN